MRAGSSQKSSFWPHPTSCIRKQSTKNAQVSKPVRDQFEEVGCLLCLLNLLPFDKCHIDREKGSGKGLRYGRVRERNTVARTALFVSPINSLRSSFQVQIDLLGQCPIERERCEEYGANLESQDQVPRLLRNFPHFVHRLVWFNDFDFSLVDSLWKTRPRSWRNIFIEARSI